MADAMHRSSSSTTSFPATARGDVRWLDVWTRAVIVPAGRRASAIWVGTAIVAAVIFGPTGMRPSDLTGLALHHPGVGATLAVTWMLIYAPTARMLLRADGAAFLRSLPGPRVAPFLLGVAALFGLQAPWVALWVIGEGFVGIAVIILVTLAITLLARWRPPRARAKWPNWRHPGAALRAIQLRALRRRAGDALVRGIGLAILAGATAGLFVRNNELHDAAASVMGAAVIAIVLVPAEVGVLLVILGAHRETAWLAGTSGCVALGSALGCARMLLAAEELPSIASRTVVGSIVVAAYAIVCLGLFGIFGVAAFGATAILAIATIPQGSS